MYRNRSVNVHQFSMVPRADIPRSGFRIESSHKTTFNAGYLIPVYCEEVLPGDSFSLRSTMFARLATPIVPIMDNLYLESFFFFVPNRLVWDRWARFMGERPEPNDSTDFLIPEVDSPVGGYEEGSIFDYFGLPTAGQVLPAGQLQVNVLPFRAYNLIWNEWFRDQNLQTTRPVFKGDTMSPSTDFVLMRRGKRHDYFTSCLPWVQKGDSVMLPLGGQAPVYTSATDTVTGAQTNLRIRDTTGAYPTNAANLNYSGSNGNVGATNASISQSVQVYPSNLYADLSEATAATINQIRQAFQIQKLLERDARGGTRYTEITRAHFGVISPDARLQRPEYLGGGMTPINIHPVAQTQSSDTGTTPQGNLAAVGTALAKGHGFTQSFTEHGYVIGLISVRADLNYQQGLHRMWTRRTRYDFYWPVFAMLGEQAVLNRELYCQGDGGTQDALVFGYQERWAEYRYKPSQITGKLRSTSSTPLDVWHLAQEFSSLPTLNSQFIEDNPPVDRIVATTEQTGDQFVIDILFSNKVARPLPMYSVPGLVDHF